MMTTTTQLTGMSQPMVAQHRTPVDPRPLSSAPDWANSVRARVQTQLPASQTYRASQTHRAAPATAQAWAHPTNPADPADSQAHYVRPGSQQCVQPDNTYRLGVLTATLAVLGAAAVLLGGNVGQTCGPMGSLQTCPASPVTSTPVTSAAQQAPATGTIAGAPALSDPNSVASPGPAAPPAITPPAAPIAAPVAAPPPGPVAAARPVAVKPVSAEPKAPVRAKRVEAAADDEQTVSEKDQGSSSDEE